jgi:hypothetical protein
MSHDKTECVPEVNETVNHASAGQA